MKLEAQPADAAAPAVSRISLGMKKPADEQRRAALAPMRD